MPITPRTLILFFLLAASSQIGLSQTSPSSPQARKIAEIDAQTSHVDLTARLDAFIAAVRSEPGSRGWLFYYSGATLPGAATRLLLIAERYLRENGDIPSGNMMGGDREISTVELWLVPEGANKPRPTPMPVRRDYREAFLWDEMNYFLETERIRLTPKAEHALNSNFYYNQSEWLDSYARQLMRPQSPRGMLVIFLKRGDPPALAVRIAEYQKRFLYRAAGIDPSHVSVSTPATLSDIRKVQLWLGPGPGTVTMGAFTPTNQAALFARLDELVAIMQSLTGSQSGSTAHIIVYSGACEGEYGKKLLAPSLMASMKQYLVQKKRVPANQLVFTDGGVMDKCEVEMWLVTPGSTLTPKPKLREP